MLTKDFKEFVALFNANAVEYLIVGGYAMALHGRPRQIGDLDVWIARTPDNAGRVMAALGAFGFAERDLTPEDFTAADRVVQLGYPPLRMDILTSIDGVDFDAAYDARQTVSHDGQQLPFIGLADLKAKKRAVGRARDLDDLEQLP
jgi:hypothetical protein